MTPVYLPSQHAPVRDLPDDEETRRAVLAEAVRSALAHQQPDGNLEDPAADDDIGDMSLGVTSLLCLAWQRGDRRDEELATAVRRSVDYFLTHRVFTTDNPGEPFLRVRNSGVPYARYIPATGEHPFGDWPSTVWAMLHAVNILELGPDPLTEQQYARITELAAGYWRWLTEVSIFNPQGTANQAIGCVAAGLMLGRHVRGQGRKEEGDRISAAALALYTDVIRPESVTDRGIRLPLEHGAGHDQNYLPISLTFLAQAYQVSGEPVFAQDGEQIARHLDYRLSARGFDYGGPRYSEQHCGDEGVPGLRFFAERTRLDLGRYLGDRRVGYYARARNGAPSGHFAFTAVWALRDTTPWYRGDDGPALTPYSLRHGRASVSLTGALTPYLIDAGGTAVIEAITDQQHGIGPVVRYPDGRTLLLTRPLGPMRSRDALAGGLAAKLVTKAVVTRDQVMLRVQQLYVTDGERLHLFCALDRGALPDGAEPAFLAGLPYAAEEGERQRRLTVLTEPGGREFALDQPEAELATAEGAVLAGAAAIRSAGGLRIVNPPAGPAYFTSPQTAGLTLEQASFALADDPRGYGNPDSGWQRMLRTNHLLAAPLAAAPRESAVFALRYGPAEDPDPFQVGAEATREGLLVRTGRFTALIGDPAGDGQGEPRLEIHPTRPPVR
jgi:hypothetical protein